MTPPPPGRYVLDHADVRYEIEDEAAGTLGNRARLFAAGAEVAEGKADLEAVKLEHGPLTVKVHWDVRHRIKKIDARIDGERVFFVPPEGTLLARLERWERERPVLYASRHVALATGEVAIGLLGIGALIKLVLPRIPWPDLPSLDLPSLDLPNLPRPDLPDLVPDLPDLPDLTLPGWVQGVVQALKFVGPVLVAITVAAHEVRRNRRKHAARRAAAEREEADNGDGGPERDARVSSSG